MKKLIDVVALLAITGLTGAQNEPSGFAKSKYQRAKNLSPEERGSHEARKMESRLKLTAEQKKSWEAAATQRAGANKPLKEKMRGSTTPEERSRIGEEMRRNNQEFDNTVIAFLNADQRSQYAEEKQRRKEARKRHHKGNR